MLHITFSESGERHKASVDGKLELDQGKASLCSLLLHACFFTFGLSKTVTRSRVFYQCMESQVKFRPLLCDDTLYLYKWICFLNRSLISGFKAVCLLCKWSRLKVFFREMPEFQLKLGTELKMWNWSKTMSTELRSLELILSTAEYI